MNDLGILVRREFKILLVSVKQVLAYSSFFLLAFLLFAFSVGPKHKILSSIYFPILFIFILFSLILTLITSLMRILRMEVLKNYNSLAFPLNKYL